jgi:hypothetical protein
VRRRGDQQQQQKKFNPANVFPFASFDTSELVVKQHPNVQKLKFSEFLSCKIFSLSKFQ